MADIRSHGLFIIGTSETDFLQGYNAPSAPGDRGGSQLLTGFGLESWSTYGLTPGSLSIDSYTETATEIADGNDALLGGEGNDTLLGGGGNDSLIGGAAGFFGNDDVLYGGWGDDVLIAGNAAQTTDGGEDKLYGGPGDDILNGMDFADTLDGGAGVDVAIYSLPIESYTVNIDHVTGVVRITDPAGFTDELAGVEYAFFGTSLAPTPAEAKARIERFEADPSSEPLVKAIGMVFTSSDDTVDFNHLTSPNVGVVASLTVEQMRDALYDGRDGNDIVRLPDKANYGSLSPQWTWDSGQLFQGGDGNDQITGGDGDDFIAGGIGDDTLNGGKGADTFYGVDAQLTGDIKESGQNFIDGGDNDPDELDIIIYNGLRNSYTVKYSPDDKDRIFTAAGNQDTVTNYDRLKFNDTVILYEDKWKAGVLAFALWSLDDAFDKVGQFLGTSGLPESQNFKNVLKWFDIVGKVVGLGAQVATATDLKTAAKILVGKSTQEFVNPIIDQAVERLNKAIDNQALIPESYKNVLKEKVQEGRHDLQITIDQVTATVFNAAIDTAEVLKDTDWNALWKTWMSGVSQKVEEKYKETPGFVAPKVEFDNPQLPEPEIKTPPETSPQGTDLPDLILGSSGDDTLYPGAGNDVALGFSGNDTIIAGAGNGDDLYDGGDGVDTITYTSTTLGIVVDLQLGVASGEEIQNDTLANIENVTGGKGQDILKGDDNANILTGGEGDDRLEGRGGLDTARYQGLSSDFLITDNGDGTFKISDMQAADGDEGTDTLVGMEQVQFGDGVIKVLTGGVGGTPVAAEDSYIVDEDATLVVGAPGVLGNDTDPEGDPLAAALLDGPSHGTLALAPDGSLTYTPNANYHGTDSFTYRANDGSVDSSPTTVTLTVNSVNDGPTGSADTATTTAGQSVALAAAMLLANDTDADGDTLAIAGVNGAIHGTASFDAITNEVTFTPDVGYTGPASFTYTISDGNGGTAEATVNVTVNAAEPTNAAPVALADSYSTNEDVALAVVGPGVLGNDTDGDNNPLTATLVTGPSHGELTLNADGSFTYTPNANYNGTDSFAYRANDGAADSAPVTVDLTVTAVNDAPAAVSDTTTALAGKSIVISAGTLLANDTDADGDTLSITGVGGASNGTATFDAATKEVTFTPDAGYTGPASFTYTIADGNGGTAEATVNVSVDPAGPFTPYDTGLNTPGELVNALFSNSPGIVVDPASVHYVGASGQASFYDGSLTGLGIGSGILLTSGDGTPPTTNTSSNYSVNQGGDGDADLTKVLSDAGFSQATLDVDFLEFSFTVTDPTIKSISLDVVFGSDEYPEFASNIVDVAGVFVNGVNYALFNSDPTQPLSVLQKNIDTGSFVNNGSGTLPIEYDGASIPLKVTAPVVQGLNTIKIAIADTSDRIYDSGLFVSNFKASTDETGGGIIVDPEPEPENTSPVIIHNTLTPPLSSCSPFVTPGPDDLSATDDDGDTLTYTIDRLPAGVLLVNGAIAGVGTSFTQSDIDAGLVTLFAGALLPSTPINTPKGPIPGAGVSFADSFDFTVHDGAGGDVSGIFTAPYQSFDKVQTTPAYCDSYNGGSGNDYQLGTAKADHMSGGAGCDLMIGGSGNDKMEGGKGNDRLFGQDGHDTLAGGVGNDLLDGGAGNDTLDGGSGDNWLFGGDGNDKISAGSGHDHIYGGAGADHIEAGSGNNRIDGGDGKDDIRSGKGNDTVVGGAGNDLIRDEGGINKFQLGGIGGAISDGNDHYWTGKGADEFILLLNDRNGGDAGWGSDTIYDFRLKQGDHLLAFNPKAGFWDDASDLASLVDQGFVSGQRSANGGDLTLTFGTGDVSSSVTLKEFFWNNASYLSPSEKVASCGGTLASAALVGILEDVVMDGSSVGVDGADYLAKAHHYISQDFLV